MVPQSRCCPRSDLITRLMLLESRGRTSVTCSPGSDLQAQVADFDTDLFVLRLKLSIVCSCGSKLVVIGVCPSHGAMDGRSKRLD